MLICPSISVFAKSASFSDYTLILIISVIEEVTTMLLTSKCVTQTQVMMVSLLVQNH